MKNGKVASTLLAVLLFVLTLTACGPKNGKGPESSAPGSSQSTVSSLPESSAASSGTTSVDAASSESSEVLMSQPSESQNGPVLTVETDDKAFDKKFADNPIDKVYISEAAKAVSNVDMVNVSEKYSTIWQQEITHAYAELTKQMKTDSSTKPQQLKAEQAQWENGKGAALKKIGDDAQAEGGSMAQVNEASKVMDFYRGRAAQLYRELYSYDKNYSYAYKAN
jgi:Protein of unknown function (DUF1311).